MTLRSFIRPALVSALALVAATAPARATLMPEVVAALGGTGAVEGKPNGGGAAVALSLLWPLEDHFHAGIMMFADDLGSQSDRLIAPGGADLGPIQGLHRQASGVAWRVEAELPGKRYEPFAAMTWGLYRASDDVQGHRVGSRTSTGLGFGAGILRHFSNRHSAGLSLRYQHLTRGATDGYMSAAFEWRWRIGAGR